MGAEIVTGCAVDGLVTAGGAVTGVATQQGEIRTKTVVCAAGAWSSRFLARAGIRMPQLAIRGTVSRTERVRELTPAGVWAPELAFRQRRDGTLNIVDGAFFDYDVVPETLRFARDFRPLWKLFGKYVVFGANRALTEGLLTRVPGTEACRHPFRRVPALDPPPKAVRVQNALKGLARVYPDLGPVEVTRSWAGAIDMTPDMIPVLGPVDGLKGLVLATGFSGHGFMLGPVVGSLLAELIEKGTTRLDISPFRLARFADGSSAGPRPLI
jgi:glycine/D-amino acid oxidase-like deaminating enzyme